MSKNDVTGDDIKSKVSTKEYEDNYERIFRNKPETNKSTKRCYVPCQLSREHKPCECSKGWDEKRMDIIGQNGNVGYDLDEIYQRVERDYQE
jgi:hypothetical protein